MSHKNHYSIIYIVYRISTWDTHFWRHRVHSFYTPSRLQTTWWNYDNVFFFHLNKSLQINYQSVVSFTTSTGHSCNKPRLRTTRCFQRGCDWWEFIWHSKFSFICFCYYRYLHFCNFVWISVLDWTNIINHSLKQ